MDDPPLAMRDRVFFDRDALSPEFRALPTPGVDRANITLAALGPAKGGSLTDSGPRLWSEPGGLPWASTPAVPPLLSKPVAKGNAPAAKLPMLEDLSLRALESALMLRPPSRSGRLRLFESKKTSSERSRPAISRLSLERMSTRWTDPLASLSFDGDSGATAPEFIMPFANGRVSSLFNQGRRHPAIDLAGTLGSPVLATTSRQTVVFAGRRGGYGNAVMTRDQYGRTHLYAHLKSITSKVGQVLDQGEKLGHLGSTGRSTGPHVHYEVRSSKGQHINPVTLLFPDRRVAKGYAWLDVRQEQRPAKLVAGLAAHPRPR
jgi:murein DD-endopeptidase MepM/ murein hydrolase activator NlpD